MNALKLPSATQGRRGGQAPPGRLLNFCSQHWGRRRPCRQRGRQRDTTGGIDREATWGQGQGTSRIQKGRHGRHGRRRGCTDAPPFKGDESGRGVGGGACPYPHPRGARNVRGKVCYPCTGKGTFVVSGVGCPCRIWRSYAPRRSSRSQSRRVVGPTGCRFLQDAATTCRPDCLVKRTRPLAERCILRSSRRRGDGDRRDPGSLVTRHPGTTSATSSGSHKPGPPTGPPCRWPLAEPIAEIQRRVQENGSVASGDPGAVYADESQANTWGLGPVPVRQLRTSQPCSAGRGKFHS